MFRRYRLHVLLAGLLVQLGCASLPTGVPRPPSAAQDNQPIPQVQIDLPPEKAAQACFVTAQELEKNGRTVEAIGQYARARDYNPQLPGVSRRLALLYDRQGDFDHALPEYKAALESAPHDVDLLNDVGYCCFERGDLSQAEKYLRQANALNPKSQRVWVNLGLVLGYQERYPESVDAFARAVSPAEARSNVAVILAKQGKVDQAKQALHEALALQPDLKEARAVLAVLENHAADTAPAVTQTQEIVNQKESNAQDAPVAP